MTAAPCEPQAGAEMSGGSPLRENAGVHCISHALARTPLRWSGVPAAGFAQEAAKDQESARS